MVSRRTVLGAALAAPVGAIATAPPAAAAPAALSPHAPGVLPSLLPPVREAPDATISLQWAKAAVRYGDPALLQLTVHPGSPSTGRPAVLSIDRLDAPSLSAIITVLSLPSGWLATPGADVPPPIGSADATGTADVTGTTTSASARPARSSLDVDTLALTATTYVFAVEFEQTLPAPTHYRAVLHNPTAGRLAISPPLGVG